MRIAYKYRLYPTKQQAETIGQWIGQARFVYNYSLGKQKELYDLGGEKKRYSGPELYKMYAQKKNEPEFNWLSSLPASSANCEIRNLDTAYKNFFNGLKKGMRTGFPKFKKKQIAGSIQFQQSDVLNGAIKVPKLGNVKAVIHRMPNGKFDKYTIFTLSRTSTYKYYISFSAELPDPAVKEPENCVGIDLGAADLAILSNGIKYPALNELKQITLRVQKMQSKLDKRKTKGSNNYRKARQRINRLHEKISNKRSYILHRYSREIADQFDFVAMEDLNVKGMTAKAKANKNKAGKYVRNNKAAKSGLTKSIVNNSLGEFTRLIEYKVAGEGGQVRKIDRWYPSSKTCSSCGEKTTDKMTLAVREWTCKSCGEVHDRDINAAMNILKEALK